MIEPPPIASIVFRSKAFVWRGPAPFLFAEVPEEHTGELQFAARQASYGWGVIPVEAQIGRIRFSTSLIPRAGRFLLPIKLAVQRGADVGPGDIVDAELCVRPRRPA